jgi:starch-binding outer membrane protein SusE/F
MKNIYKILLALSTTLIVACATNNVEDRPIIEAILSPEMQAPQNDKQFVLLEVNGVNEADRFVWSAAKYSDNVVVEYSLLMDKKGGDFKNAKLLEKTTGITNAAIAVKKLNQAAIELGAKPGVLSQFDLVVESKVSGGVPMMSKKPITIGINSYSGLISYPFVDWYLVGDATVSGWDNNKGNQPLFRSGTNPKQYVFTGFFKAGAFKIISSLGNWAPMYGKGDGNTIVYRGTTADQDPDSFKIETDGYYSFTVNIDALTYSLVSYDATSSKAYDTVGIIGDSTPKGWDASTAMTKSSFDTHIWTIELIDLKDGAAKFRANDAWDDDWGGASAFSGYNGYKGPNIPVAKSKYKVYFNDLDGGYLMIPNQK